MLRRLQEGAAAQRRMDHSTIYWLGRQRRAAEAVKRKEMEPYLWRPFTSLKVPLCGVLCNSAAMQVSLCSPICSAGAGALAVSPAAS